MGEFDHGSDPRFFAHYEKGSLSQPTLDRFRTTKEKLLDLARRHGLRDQELRVADIGCGAGSQSRLWAEAGHHVFGIDVNGPLIELARQRCGPTRLPVEFTVGTATSLPYADGSMDVCLMPELLEHVADWESCVNEAVRVLRPDGLLYLSTTNALCPRQQEFTLPLYSWYPGFLKRRIERLSVTTMPGLANHTRYPAVHWFTYRQLAAYLEARGMTCFDRFAMIRTEGLSPLARKAVDAARALPPLRFLGHVLTEGTTVFAIKQSH